MLILGIRSVQWLATDKLLSERPAVFLSDALSSFNPSFLRRRPCLPAKPRSQEIKFPDFNEMFNVKVEPAVVQASEKRPPPKRDAVEPPIQKSSMIRELKEQVYPGEA